MERKFIGTPSPHLRSPETVQTVMRDVLIALLPATVGSVVIFRWNALVLIAISVLAAVLTEFLIQKFLLKKTSTISDLSAVVTGLLLAMNLPSNAPWWIAFIGAAFAIAVVKQLFGGLGHNFMNPALAARAMLVASWPGVMINNWVSPGADAISTATVLGAMKDGLPLDYTLWDLFIGNVGGCLGETSALLLIIGGIYLLVRRVINWRIPFTYLGTFVLMMLIMGKGLDGTLIHVLAGGLMLGAFFMATDYASSPVSPKGQIIYGVGCGLLTALIRQFGGYPEGVSYSILLMNVAAPLIDKLTKPKVFGKVKKS